MSDGKIIEERVDLQRAQARIRALARGRRVYLHCRQSARIVGDDEHTYDVHSCVKVSVKEALGFVKNAYGRCVNYKLLVPIAYYPHSLFIG